jgi:hypothetical protein
MNEIYKPDHDQAFFFAFFKVKQLNLHNKVVS